MSTNSCNPKEPFIKLDEQGKASILNYNLPQSTCYRATSLIELGVGDDVFRANTPPVYGSFWRDVEKYTKDEWIEKLKDEVELASSQSVFTNSNLLKKSKVRTLQKQVVTENETQESLIKIEEAKIAGVPVSNIADKIKKGFKPILQESLVGKVKLNYLPRPVKLEPKIVIMLKLKMCSYLGDYGAGRTVKTFSLLPGERTTISVKTWERDEETKTEASHVLDSVSQSNANELQTMIESELNVSSSSSSSTTNQFGGGFEAGITIPIKGIPLKIGTNASASRSRTFTSAFNNSVRNLVNSTSSQVSKADSLRQVDINTETSSTSISERENTTVRELENINKSRVLNFVFRQLLQEFFTITYLDDVSIAYVTANGEDMKVTDLGGLDVFLNEVIEDEYQDKVKAAILKRLCNITDYQGSKHSFIECVEEVLESDLECSCLPEMETEKECYFRKKEGLSQEYNGKKVNGIILDTTHRITRTSAVVVDALLGQGEALDCYNQKLQSAAVLNAELNNDKLQQAIDTINNIEDPIERTKLYKKVFTECCDVPQSGCGCNSNNNA